LHVDDLSPLMGGKGRRRALAGVGGDEILRGGGPKGLTDASFHCSSYSYDDGPVALPQVDDP
jgi:hypothetical protein